MEKSAIAVFGGSFNPPLYSHFSLAEEVLNEMDYIEKVVFVPVGNNYLKDKLEAPEHRYNMLKLVCDTDNRFEVSDIELIQEKQLNTFETLELLQKQYPDKELLFVTGTDNLKELYWWGSIELFLSKYKILVLERNKDDMFEIINSQEFLKQHSTSFIKFNQTIKTSMSSTYVRNNLKNNKTVKYLMPESVYNYIKENNLYRG